jgi:hypothetical protein
MRRIGLQPQELLSLQAGQKKNERQNWLQQASHDQGSEIPYRYRHRVAVPYLRVKNSAWSEAPKIGGQTPTSLIAASSPSIILLTYP